MLIDVICICYIKLQTLFCFRFLKCNIDLILISNREDSLIGIGCRENTLNNIVLQAAEQSCFALALKSMKNAFLQVWMIVSLQDHSSFICKD